MQDQIVGIRAPNEKTVVKGEDGLNVVFNGRYFPRVRDDFISHKLFCIRFREMTIPKRLEMVGRATPHFFHA